MDASALKRFNRKIVNQSDGCVVWTGFKNRDGYGHFNIDGIIVRTHRAIYEHYYGMISSGLTIDHLCRNRACVNPEHLEAVTPLENQSRGLLNQNTSKTHCPQGHEYTTENTYQYGTTRQCKICKGVHPKRREINAR